MNMSTSFLRQASAAVVLSCASALVGAATLSGTVTFPSSDGGDSPRIISTSVRVVGTHLAAAVAEDSVNRSVGTFTLTGVPEGAITLILEEPRGNNAPGDRFTQDSKRLQLNVTGDVSGLAFAPVFHWRNLPSYPPPYHDPNYDQWQPYFVSSEVGFLSFLNRGVSPFVHELWRTTDGAESWTKIGEWNWGTSVAIPDFVSGLDMVFADANHGVLTARLNNVPVGVLRTADGGATWEGIDFPNVPPSGVEPGGNGRISIVNYGRIDATHWIACGSENVGSYMGSGTPGYVTIWETADTGATWQIGLSWREDYGTCSAIGAEASGRAFVFDTPYAFGGNRILAVRDESGTWVLQPGNNLVTNTGYGPADAPTFGGTAWLSGARWEGYSTIEQGTYRSRDGGVTWSKVGDGLLSSLDFATELKGFATAGGPAYATYDGGRTWMYQGQGGGVCCHGNYMYAFGAADAVWKDGGVGDPGGIADVLRYAELAAPHLEVLRGSGVNDAIANNGATLVPAAALQLTSRGLDSLILQPLTVRATGTGNDHSEIAVIGLWLDRNSNGIVDGDDSALASAAFPSDNGEAVLDPAGALVLDQLYTRQLLLTYDLSLGVRDGVTFSLTVASTEVAAVTNAGSATTVHATAPAGTMIAGSTITSHVVPSATGVSLNASPGSPQIVGASVVFTAQAVGGTGTYEYQFRRYSSLTRAWTVVRPYAAGRSWAWDTSGAANCAYNVTVWARSAGSNAPYDTYSSVDFVLKPVPASSIVIQPSPPSPQAVGTSILFAAQANGGSGTYEYQFRRYSSLTQSWSVVRPYGAGNTWTWNTTGAATGAYNVTVWARSVGSTAPYDVYSSVDYTLTTAPATSVTLVPNPTGPQIVGATVVFTAQANGGSGNYEYQFRRYSSLTQSWTVVRQYGAANTWSWNTSGTAAGAYNITVWARSVGSSAPYDTYTSLNYTLRAPPAVSLGAAPVGPQMAGVAVLLTAQASGGLGNFEYQFRQYSSLTQAWTVLRPYATSNTWTWNTDGVGAGAYNITVWVRSAGSAAPYEGYSSVNYVLKPVPASSVSLVPLPASPQDVGTSVLFTAEASGGSGAYEYQFRRYSSLTQTWTVVRTYSIDNTWTWETGGEDAAAYNITVWARSVGSTAPYDTYRGVDYTLRP